MNEQPDTPPLSCLTVLFLLLILFSTGLAGPTFARDADELQKTAVHGTLAAAAEPETAHAPISKPPVMKLETIVVTGEKIADYIRKNPSQVVTMTAAEIEDRNFLQVTDVLGSMSGVDVKPGTSGLGTRISIRGSGGSGAVLVLIDGRPASTLQYGGSDLGSIPIEIVKKITVFKPPVPVWLGPGSSAGAIYIETWGASSGKGKTTKKGRIRISAGSYGQADISATCQADAKDSDTMISAGYGHNDGKRDNSQKDQGRLSLHYGKKAEFFDYQVNGKVFASDHGVSGPTYNPTPNAAQKYEKASLDLKVKGMAKDLLEYDAKTWLDLKTLKDTADSGDISELDALAAGIGSDFFIMGASEKNEVRFGMLVEYSQVDHTLTGDHDRNVFSLNGTWNYRSAPFRFTTGLRSDYFSDFHYSQGGQAGVSYEISPKTVFKAGAGYSENIPSFDQLYQPSHGAIDQVRGNPDLKREEIVSFTLGASHSFKNHNEIEISLFRTDTQNLIKYQRGTDLISRPENIGSAYTRGIETCVKFHLTAVTDVDVSHIRQDTENESNNKKLSYSPEHTLKVTLKTTFKTGTKLEVSTRAVTDQYTDNLNTESEKLDAYTTTDVKIIHPLQWCKKKTELFVHVHNLFDEDFSSHYGYPDDGFKMQAGININF